MIEEADQLVHRIIRVRSKMRREHHAFPVEIRMDAPTAMLLRMSHPHYLENMGQQIAMYMGMRFVIDNDIPQDEFRMFGESGSHRVELAG